MKDFSPFIFSVVVYFVDDSFAAFLLMFFSVQCWLYCHNCLDIVAVINFSSSSSSLLMGVVKHVLTMLQKY